MGDGGGVTLLGEDGVEAVRVETYGRESAVVLGEDVIEDSKGVKVAARAKQSK